MVYRMKTCLGKSKGSLLRLQALRKACSWKKTYFSSRICGIYAGMNKAGENTGEQEGGAWVDKKKVQEG
jgi:hypothetical protein